MLSSILQHAIGDKTHLLDALVNLFNQTYTEKSSHPLNDKPLTSMLKKLFKSDDTGELRVYDLRFSFKWFLYAESQSLTIWLFTTISTGGASNFIYFIFHAGGVQLTFTTYRCHSTDIYWWNHTRNVQVICADRPRVLFHCRVSGLYLCLFQLLSIRKFQGWPGWMLQVGMVPSVLETANFYLFEGLVATA